MPTARTLLLPIIAATGLSCGSSALAQSETKAASVAIGQDETSFTLSNGIVRARVSKRSGDLISLQYKEMEVLTDKSGHAGAYWSHDTTGGKETIARITIDPAANGGERGEISVKGISGGIKMGHGPGAAAGGDFPADIEIRYTLGRGESGVYTCCALEHLPGYPAASMTEARYCAKLADMFDWMTLDSRRNMHFPASLREGDKYIYTAVQSEHPVYGWSSTTQQIGFWLINPSQEYLSGGPTKVEFLCHRDTTPVAAPCVLNYWRSSHYGGAVVAVGEGEHWSKVIGPFFLYVNSGADSQGLWQDAKSQAAKENGKWSYDWVAGIDYPRKSDRATVKGRLALNDRQAPGATTPNLLVGLSHPPYTAPAARPGTAAPPRQIDWQIDAKHYEFWVHGDEQGQFEIPRVRPGNYTLHAFADGVLGEFVRTDITVEPGKLLDLGTLTWAPVRRGRQLWEIGIPNRNGSEFFKGSEYADPTISLQYATLFPDDMHYVIGKSDFRQDWFFQHVPHNEDPNARAVPFVGIRGNGRATPYSVAFDLPSAPKGTATLRLAICGTSARSIEVTVNDQPAGTIDRLISDGAIPRHSIQGLWYERELAFDAVLMTEGRNVLKLVVPAGPINNGIIYDYVRLELDEPQPERLKQVSSDDQKASAPTRTIADGPDPREIPVPPIKTPLGKLPGPHELPLRKAMPDVLTLDDGTKVKTKEQWNRRREEMKRTLAYYAVGQMPPAPGNVKGREIKSELAAEGKVTYRLIHLTFGPEEKLGLDIGIFTPSKGGPFPAVISPSGTPPGATPLSRLPNGPNQGRGQNVLLLVGPAPASGFDASGKAQAAPVPGKQPANPPSGRGGFGGPATAESIATRNRELFRRGYALVMFNNNDCAEDTTLRNSDGSWAFRDTRFYPAYPGYDWGILAGWAWGASRIADYLETDPAIDKSKLIITGASRAGKAAMVAAAFDERLMGAPVVTGGGGIGAYRFSGIGRGGKEGLGEMMNKYPNWFSPNLHEFWGQTDKLPFDEHWFLALCAPRPFIALEGDTDTVSLPSAVKQSILAAKPAYEFLGVPDRLGVNYAKHGHAFTQEDWDAMLDFADQHLRGMKIDRTFDQFLPEPANN